MKPIKLLIIAIFAIISAVGANELTCHQFYKQPSILFTPRSPVLELLFTEVEKIKTLGSSYNDVTRVVQIYRKLPYEERNYFLQELLKTYPQLSKDRKNRDFILPPKRAIDLLISDIASPLPLFNKISPLVAYSEYLRQIQTNSQFFSQRFILSSLWELHKDLLKNSTSGESELLVYGSFVNGRATSKSDIDIYEYLDVDKKVSYDSLNLFMKKWELPDLEISNTFGNIKHINTDIEFTLRVHPLALILTKEEIHFYIRGEDPTVPFQIFKAPISDLKALLEKNQDSPSP